MKIMPNDFKCVCKRKHFYPEEFSTRMPQHYNKSVVKRVDSTESDYRGGVNWYSLPRLGKWSSIG